MLLHEFGHGLAPALEALLEVLDALLGAGGTTAGATALEGPGAVLEEGLLPLVERARADAVLLADLGDRLPVQQVLAENLDLFLAAEVASFFFDSWSWLFPPGLLRKLNPGSSVFSQGKTLGCVHVLCLNLGAPPSLGF